MTAFVAAVVASTVVSAGVSMINSNRQKKAQNEANRIQQQANEEAKQQQIQDMRRQNQQQADLTSILEGNLGAENPSTMLAGAGGVDPGMLQLGRGAKLLGA